MSKKKNRRTRHRKPAAKRVSKGRSRTLWLASLVLIAGGILFLSSIAEHGAEATASPIEFTEVRADTAEFLAYHNSIQLTPEQEAVKKEALTRIAAPCCSDNTAYTCCCPCNMAKTWWGLAEHLIADEGYGADEVEAGVRAWIEFINPNGFTGNACYTGRCSKPFHENGCGGMNEREIVY